MLKETAAGSDGRNRRWFSDDYFDLIVWLENDESITGFQLCYDRSNRECALTWTRNSGFVHERVDDGEANPTKNRTPVLVPDGVCPIQDLIRIFSDRSRDMDAHIRATVLKQLGEFRP